MAMPPEFTRFKNEEDFTDNFLVPLHQRLGFTTVCNFHGTTELGKDLVFAEVDRFTDILFHGLQAKFVPSISLAAVEELIADAKQAFNNEFTHPQTGSRERISRFIAVNGGSISDQARIHFFNSLTPIYGANVKLLDGKSLLALDRIAVSQKGELVRERLTGLILELQHNELSLKFLEDNLPPYLEGKDSPPAAKFRLVATEGFLCQPLFRTFEETNEVQYYWKLCSNAEGFVDVLVAPAASLKFREHCASKLQEYLPLIRKSATSIKQSCYRMLSSIGISALFKGENASEAS